MNYIDFCNQFGTPEHKTYEDQSEWCVYFLLRSNEIVYIGKSSKGGIWSRIKTHQKDKVFDKYFTLGDLKTEKEALLLEGSFITIANPTYNKTGQKANPAQLGFMVDWVAKNRVKLSSDDTTKLDTGSTLLIISVFLLTAFFFTVAAIKEITGYAVSEGMVSLLAFLVLPISLFIAYKIDYNTRSCN